MYLLWNFEDKDYVVFVSYLGPIYRCSINVSGEEGTTWKFSSEIKIEIQSCFLWA